MQAFPGVCRNALVIGGGSARSLRSLAEWCAPPNETRGKDGRRGRLCRCLTLSLRRPHHSATRDSSERNLLFNSECGAQFRETRERRAEPPTASARRSEKGYPTAPQSATVRRPCRRHDTRRQAQITPHKRSAVWGVRVRCRGQRVGDTLTVGQVHETGQ